MRKILICEDDPGLREMIASVVSDGGYETVVGEDGQRGWELLEAGGADMAVLDLNMPRLDGLGLIARIRRDKRFKEMPIMLLTIRELVVDQVKGYERGADDYMTKPFDTDLLLAHLRVLERRIIR
jgi:DNA-binding response OmpR family regulator